jgi:hypothetical protein
MSEPPTIASSVRLGLAAARANLVPGLLLQVVALALVLSYYYYPPATAALTKLTAYRENTGILFGILSTGICGGVIPFFIVRFFGNLSSRQSLSIGILYSVFWAYKGLEIEIWYRILAEIFGNGHDLWTILLKTITDQCVYCPILAIPLTMLAYSWGQFGFSFSRVLEDVRTPGWYSRRVLTPLISNLGVWLPAVAIIYALPLPLQLPLQNIVLVFFTLLLAQLTKTKKAHGERKA